MTRPILCSALLIATIAACATPVPPRVRVVNPIDDFGEGAIFVQSNRDQPQIVEAFEEEGLLLAEGPAGADLIVRARVGRSRGSNECGPIHNVQYQLWQRNYQILLIVARGPVGNCPDSVNRQIGREIVGYLNEQGAQIAGPPPPPAPLPQAVPPPTADTATPQPAAEPPEPEVSTPVRTDAPAPRPQLGGAD